MSLWKNVTDLSYRQIRDLQNQRLHEFINMQVYPFSAHYRKLFDEHKIKPHHIRRVEDLKLLPFTSKLDLVCKENPAKFKDFILAPDKEKIRKSWPVGKLLDLAAQGLLQGQERVQDDLAREYRPLFMTFTTGTTSTPVAFMYSGHDIKNLNLSGARMFELFNVARDERIMNIFPFAPHLAFWQVFFGAMESNVFALSTGGGKVLGTEGNMTALLRVKPAMILGVPSYIYHLVRFAQDKGQDLSFVKKIVVGAAKVNMAYKQKLAEMFAGLGAKDVQIFGTYGFTEARSAWAECPAANDVSSGYHLYPDREIFEVIDPETGEVLGEGEDGELVYTPLDSRASVVLRYRTGDFVKGGITYGACPHCGRTTLRLSSDISRLSDTKDLQLSKVKGTLVNLNHFGSVLNDITEVEEWQIEICKRHNDPYEVDEVVVYIALRSQCSEELCANMIRDKLIGATEVAPNAIKFMCLADIIKRLELETANKEKRILDSRPKI